MMTIYRVQPGDTLPQIAQRFGVSIETIAIINGFDATEALVIGMELVIPTIAASQVTVRHIVRPWDSLWSIARDYSIHISQLVQINSLYYPYTLYTGQVLTIGFRGVSTSQEKRSIETLGYYDPAADPNKPALIDELGGYLTYIGLFEFPITETGEIIGTIDPDVLAAAERNDAALLPVLTNLREGSFDPDLARTVLSNPTTLNNLIDNIIALLQQHDLLGVIIDFENLYPEDRELFTSFIRLLSERLHSENKILVLNLAAKWAEWAEKQWVGFFDYNALGPLIDIAAIMTYEWGYREGPPDPTAPLPFVRTTLDYAIANNIPADKILMGMTLYGYDWELPDTPENLASTVTLPEVWDLGRRHGSTILFDDQVQQPYMTYTDDEGINHEIWFENARSHYSKYQLITEYGLRGVFYWIIHMPFPSTWYMVSELFNIRKV